MIQQLEITLTPKSRGFHLVTSEIIRQLPKLPKTGIINIFCKHTSCGLSINENADPDVRVDMETIFNRLVPENRPEYEHTLEGADDMPAHAKSTNETEETKNQICCNILPLLVCLLSHSGRWSAEIPDIG